jgi:hypothetical protein
MVLDRAYNFRFIWIAVFWVGHRVLWVVTNILEESASFLRVEVSSAVMWMG